MNANPQRILGIDTVGNYNNILEYRVTDLITSNDTIGIRYDSIGLNVIVETLSAHYNKILTNGYNSLYAFQVVGLDEKFSDIEITSDKDYDRNHLAGTNLTEILSFHIAHHTQAYTVDQFIEEYTSHNESILIRFITEPNFENIHTFKIICFTESGNRFESSVKNILILKKNQEK